MKARILDEQTLLLINKGLLREFNAGIVKLLLAQFEFVEKFEAVREEDRTIKIELPDPPDWLKKKRAGGEVLSEK